jgi:hypothetical protein
MGKLLGAVLALLLFRTVTALSGADAGRSYLAKPSRRK